MDRELIARVAVRDQAEEPPAHLRRSDWLAAAVQIFVDEGLDAVRITRLAEVLSVTRGSFYWHFKGRGDLLDGLIAFWSQKNTAALVNPINGVESLSEGLLTLYDSWIEPGRFDPRLDQAMREWARRSDAVKKAVAEADEVRVKAIEALFTQFGFKNPEAFIRARIIYFTQIGYFAVLPEESLYQRLGYLETYYEALTGAPLDADAAKAYRRKHLEDDAS